MKSDFRLLVSHKNTLNDTRNVFFSTVNDTGNIILAHAHQNTAARLATTFTITFTRSTRRNRQTPTRTKSTWSILRTAPFAQFRTVWPIGRTIPTCTTQVCPRCEGGRIRHWMCSLEGRIDDCWNVDGGRDMDQFHPVHNIERKASRCVHVVRRLTKVQATSRPDSCWPGVR